MGGEKFREKKINGLDSASFLYMLMRIFYLLLVVVALKVMTFIRIYLLNVYKLHKIAVKI